MITPKHYDTHCPECHARIRLPIVVREQRHDYATPGHVNLGLTVDLTKMHEHMRFVHRIEPREVETA